MLCGGYYRRDEHGTFRVDGRKVASSEVTTCTWWVVLRLITPHLPLIITLRTTFSEDGEGQANISLNFKSLATQTERRDDPPVNFYWISGKCRWWLVNKCLAMFWSGEVMKVGWVEWAAEEIGRELPHTDTGTEKGEVRSEDLGWVQIEIGLSVSSQDHQLLALLSDHTLSPSYFLHLVG